VLKRVIVYTILLGWTAWIAFPLYWLAILPFKRGQDVSGRTTYLPFIDFTPTTQALGRAFTPGSDAVRSACWAQAAGRLSAPAPDSARVRWF
jgi:ABC-type glycerol-3-phosphate transport system permease component